jgi:hypothetical protein
MLLMRLQSEVTLYVLWIWRLWPRRWIWRRFNFCFNRRIIHSFNYRRCKLLLKKLHERAGERRGWPNQRPAFSFILFFTFLPFLHTLSVAYEGA